MYTCIVWKFKTKQKMVLRMIHVNDSLLSMGKAWCLDFLLTFHFTTFSLLMAEGDKIQILHHLQYLQEPSKNHGITKTKAQLVVWKSLDET